MPPNTRLQPTLASQPKLLEEQRRAVLLREGRLWPRLSKRTLKMRFNISCYKRLLNCKSRPSGPHSRILRIGSPRFATKTARGTRASSFALRGQDNRCSSLGGQTEPPAVGCNKASNINRRKMMKGIEIKKRNGYYWMRIGSADKIFINTIMIIATILIIYLTYWAFQEIPNNSRRLSTMLFIYGVTGILYMNLGVWIHEQLHYLGLSGLEKRNHVKIVYIRKCILLLSGYYRVIGQLNYQMIKKALLSPLYTSLASITIGVIGYFFFPRWWLPLMLTIAIYGIIDMTTDIYWYKSIRNIGEKGKYWDRGRELHVVWRQDQQNIP